MSRVWVYQGAFSRLRIYRCVHEHQPLLGYFLHIDLFWIAWTSSFSTVDLGHCPLVWRLGVHWGTLGEDNKTTYRSLYITGNVKSSLDSFFGSKTLKMARNLYSKEVYLLTHLVYFSSISPIAALIPLTEWIIRFALDFGGGVLFLWYPASSPKSRNLSTAASTAARFWTLFSYNFVLARDAKLWEQFNIVPYSSNVSQFS